jgi:hypothetical protein
MMFLQNIGDPYFGVRSKKKLKIEWSIQVVQYNLLAEILRNIKFCYFQNFLIIF